MQKITTFLMFPERGEEAVRHYAATFKGSKIHSIAASGGRLHHARFALDGHEFYAMDAGPYFSFGNGMSLFVDCASQREIDDYTAKLLQGGGEQQPCGWVKDRFGVSWQIIPTTLGPMLQDPKSGNAQAVMEAMLRMTKLDMAALEKAYRKK
jgi:predicted 3-demethylubiquinone-9 3-methyltransferase (glyoxalase superfamily)